jgi:hypothetical protein
MRTATTLMAFTCAALGFSPAYAKGKPAAEHPHQEHSVHDDDGKSAAESGDKAEPVKPEPAKTEAPAESEREQAKHPTHMKVGIELESLSKLELGPGTYNAEFYLTFRCDAEPCKPDFTVTNGRVVSKDAVINEATFKVFKVKTELEAYVDLSQYPFDAHLLPIGIIDKNEHAVVYDLDPASTKMAEGVRLPGWEVANDFTTGTEVHKLGDGTELKELQFVTAVKRPLLPAVFKSIMPLFFLLFVAAFTLLLKPKSASARLAAGTGGLTAAVAFHLGQINSLPPLGYLTRMDKFMTCSYLVYVVSIAFSIAMVRMEEKKNERASERTYLVASGVVPAFAIISWLNVILNIL